MLLPTVPANHHKLSSAKHGLPTSERPLRLVRVLLFVAVILAATGGSMTSPDNQPSTVSTGRALTRVAVVLFMAIYVFLLGLHIALWGTREHIPTYHRTVRLPSHPLYLHSQTHGSCTRVCRLPYRLSSCDWSTPSLAASPHPRSPAGPLPLVTGRYIFSWASSWSTWSFVCTSESLVI